MQNSCLMLSVPSLYAGSMYFMHWMQGINGTTEIIQTTMSDVGLDRIIGRNAFSLEKVLDMEPDFLKVPPDNNVYPQ